MSVYTEDPVTLPWRYSRVCPAWKYGAPVPRMPPWIHPDNEPHGASVEWRKKIRGIEHGVVDKVITSTGERIAMNMRWVERWKPESGDTLVKTTDGNIQLLRRCD